MGLQPKKNSVEETPQHSWPVVRPDERPAGEALGLWQRIRGWFRLRPATGNWPPASPPDISTPTWEPLRLSFPATDDFASFDDNYEDLAKIAANNPGTLILFSSLDGIFDNRPFDVPFYTARKGRALIALVFSKKILPSATTLERVSSGDHPMTLDLAAFLEGKSPILRANFLFPDSLRSSLVLETLLNLCDEDVQEFLQAAVDSDELDLLLRHESNPDVTIDLSVSVPRLRGLVYSQLAAFGSDWHRNRLPAELPIGSQATALVYRSSQYGSNRDAGVKLRRTGRAKCLLR